MTTTELTVPSPVGKKARPCPALGGLIKPADCGAQRGSKLACPPDCPYFPFGTAAYELLLKIEEGGIKKASRFLFDHAPKALMEHCYREGKALYAGHDRAEIMATGYLLFSLMGPHRGSAGKSLLEEWESQRWDGLNNDERLLMQFRQRGIMTVLEVQKILPPNLLVCHDLFRPEAGELKVYDRILAASTPRFTRVLCCVYPMPHYYRTSQVAFIIPSAIWTEWEQAVLERYEARRSSEPSLSISMFLSQNFMSVFGLIAEMSDRIKLRILKQLDLKLCTAQYQLKTSASQVESHLKGKPEFEVTPPPAFSKDYSFVACFNWYARGESGVLRAAVSTAETPDSPGSDDLIGTIFLAEKVLLFQSTRDRAFAQARSFLEERFSDLLQFYQESFRDLGQEAALHQVADAEVSRVTRWLDVSAKSEAEPVAPAEPQAGQAALSQEEHRRHALDQHQQRYAAFLDQPSPVLDRKTPREAAIDLNLRPRLRELIKGHIHQMDLKNRNEGLDLNLDWILDALDLQDLKA
jgi:hypothetical protein